MWLQAQTSLIHSCSWATNSTLRHSLGHPWPPSADSAPNSPHKSHFNPLKWGLNSYTEPDSGHWSFLSLCAAAIWPLWSFSPFCPPGPCISATAGEQTSWKFLKSHSGSPPSWLTPIPQGCTLSPPAARVQPAQHPKFYLMLWSLVPITSRSPSPATRAFRDAAKAGHGPSPPPKGPAVQICFHWSWIHSPADAARTHRHTPQALG